MAQARQKATFLVVVDSAPSAVRMGTGAGRAVIAAAALGIGMAFLDGTVVNVALRTIGKDLDASLSQLQWITNGYLLSLASLILLGGSLGDRFGRRADLRHRHDVVRVPRRCCAAWRPTPRC